MTKWERKLQKATQFILAAREEDIRVPEPEDDPLVHAIESIIDLEDLLEKEGRVFGKGPVLNALLRIHTTLEKNIKQMEKAYYPPR